jgi:hypothetical protein
MKMKVCLAIVVTTTMTIMTNMIQFTQAFRTTTWMLPQTMRRRRRTTTTATTNTLLWLTKRDKSSTKTVTATTTTTTTTSENNTNFWQPNTDCWRPTVNDVERISWGKPAKHKGVGSRGVPHRLNVEERMSFDRARTKGFLEVTGSAWRSQRRDAPLLNSYRSLCDARAQVAIVLHKSPTGMDDVVIDLSPLRNPKMFLTISQHCLQYQTGGEIFGQDKEDTSTTTQTDTPEDTSSNSNSSSSTKTETTTSENENIIQTEVITEDTSPWDTKPIYQLPPFCVTWNLPRSEAKQVSKKMSELFHTAEGKRAASKKPIGIKPGKSRRHGGYGIG